MSLFDFYSELFLSSYKWTLGVLIILSLVLFGNEQTFFGSMTLVSTLVISFLVTVVSWSKLQDLLREEGSRVFSPQQNKKLINVEIYEENLQYTRGEPPNYQELQDERDSQNERLSQEQEQFYYD